MQRQRDRGTETDGGGGGEEDRGGGKMKIQGLKGG